MNSGTCTICAADTYKGGTNPATSCSNCGIGHSTNGATGKTAASQCDCEYSYYSVVSFQGHEVAEILTLFSV